jgi:hypothetical protein
MTDAPYKVERPKMKPLPLTTRRRRKASEALLSAKIAIEEVIQRINARQKVAAIKVKGLNAEARMTIRKTKTKWTAAIKLLQL